MSDSDSSTENIGILKKALDVTLPEDFNPNSVPTNGEEYLHHVIYERTRHKKCVKADKDFSAFKKNQTIHVTDENHIQKSLDKFYPTAEWEERVLKDFIQVRQFIEKHLPSQPIKCNFSNELLDKTPPLFSEISTYSQSGKLIMLQQLSRSLDHFDPDVGISDNIGARVYAILALLGVPLSPDSCYNLREFAKKCANVRAKLNSETKEQIYAPLNLFICIITKHFAQCDLA
ncbi:gem-associated protein 2 [Cylas formicarius]|uniref:gem-associated protein 2 n=1 Tax=Cylas formicarius TaxID=197179 RepID=UPI002958D33E|nr:gem-associated protein 2 [Cylas formicarius]